MFLFDPDNLALVVAIAVIVITPLLMAIRFFLANKNKALPRPTVAVIGCGPTGMFFMHAIVLRRQKMEEEGDVEGLAKLPKVTCFEKCSQPGGVWRSAAEAQTNAMEQKQQNGGTCSSGSSPCPYMGEEKDRTVNNVKESEMKEETTNMYEALWTNGHALLLEMFDYTFDDHFKRPVLSYMPRAAILDYILARVTRNNPTFFEDTTLFETKVDKVTYDKNIKKFRVTSTNLVTGKVSVGLYDKCLWGAGTNGKKKIPRSFQDMLIHGNYQGKIMHSSEAGNCLDEFKGKRVLFVGDAYSAEDLALMGCKLGIEQMYIFSRQGRGSCCDVTCWPSHKVEVIEEREFTGVIQNGKGLRFEESYYNSATGKYEREEDGEIDELENVDAVIYCTGYHPNQEMLDESLFNDEDSSVKKNQMRRKWQMKKNALSSELGHVKPHRVFDVEEIFGMHRPHYYGLDLSNPNLMLSYESFIDVSLLEIDTRSWFFLGCILGDIEIPSKEKMIDTIAKNFKRYMDIPELRVMIDPNYRMEVGEFEDDHWCNDLKDDRTKEMADEYIYQSTMELAGIMKNSLYPVSFLTSDGKLNDKGKKFLEISQISTIDILSEEYHPDEVEWRTYRDHHSEKYASIYSGTKLVPMKQHWMDIDESDLSNIF